MIDLNALIDSTITKVQVNDKWYYSYDRKHYEPLTARFQEIKVFSDGMAAVRLNGSCGYISLDGEISIPIQYDYCGDFNQGVASVSKQDKYRLIDKTNNALTPWGEYFGSHLSAEGYRTIRIDGKWGFADIAGNVVLEPKYDNCGIFTEGLVAVESNKKWGYIDARGEWVIAPVYECARCFRDGIARVIKNQQWSYIDKTGCEVIYSAVPKSSYDYSSLWSYHSKTYTVFSDNGQWGVKTNKGDVIVPPQFEEANMLYENIVGVKWNGLWDIIHLK